MKKTSKKSEELTVDNTEDDRDQWLRLLEHAVMFHKQMVIEHKSPIIGAEPSQDEMFHRAIASAIEDCILLIQIAADRGMFDDMPQYSKGPAG